ncbi:hypothetical protein RCL1_003589 [Eukaryota sp. TZLM3-RCL]
MLNLCFSYYGFENFLFSFSESTFVLFDFFFVIMTHLNESLLVKSSSFDGTYQNFLSPLLSVNSEPSIIFVAVFDGSKGNTLVHCHPKISDAAELEYLVIPSGCHNHKFC